MKPINDVKLNGQSLKWSDSVKHLGNMINAHNYDRDDIKRKKGDFIARTNSILANFRSASRQAKKKLFKSKCCVFYGPKHGVSTVNGSMNLKSVGGKLCDGC